MSNARNIADVSGATAAGSVWSNRNLLINGDFQVSQRGDFTSQQSIPASGYYVDRWRTSTISGSPVHQHKLNQVVGGVVTNTYRVTVTATAVNGGFAIAQKVEFPEKYAGATLTFSFWYQSNFDSYLNWYDGISQPMVALPSTGGSWKKFVTTYTMPSNPTDCRVEFYPWAVAPTSGQYLEIALCQLERGSVATPFEHRPYGTELALCQRYFYKWQAYTGAMLLDSENSVAQSVYHVKEYTFPVPMRATPSYSGGGTWTSSNLESGVTALAPRGNQGCFVQRRSAAVGRSYLYSPDGSAYTNFDAEL